MYCCNVAYHRVGDRKITTVSIIAARANFAENRFADCWLCNTKILLSKISSQPINSKTVKVVSLKSFKSRLFNTLYINLSSPVIHVTYQCLCTVGPKKISRFCVELLATQNMQEKLCVR